MSSEIRKTPLFSAHSKRSAKMIEFAGWQMPLQFKGIRHEHLHVRKNLGLFDVSHMGEIRIRGREALKTLQWLTTNDVSVLKKGQAQYNLLLNKEGGIVDDLILYCFRPNENYLLCVNASNIKKDLKFLMENNRGGIIEDESLQWGQIAIQGPKAFHCLKKVTGLELKETSDFSFSEWLWQGQTCLIALTGYTGEKGVEIFVPWDLTESLWEKFLKDCPSAEPVGLGARDSLRLEMAYPLYGQDMDEHSLPQEVGLGWTVKLNKGEFLGCSQMMATIKSGRMGQRVGIELTEPGIARKGYRVFSENDGEIGVVTSGTLSPSLNKAIALVQLFKKGDERNKPIFVEIRNRKVRGKIVKTPFYKRQWN